MRIRVLSDLHLEIWPFEVARAEADVVVLAGDIANGAQGIHWAARSFAGPVIYVAGNHEPYDGEFHETRDAICRAARGTNVQVLDCGELRVAGVRFLGCTLWTDYSLPSADVRARVIEDARGINPDYRAIRNGERTFSPEDAIELHRAHRTWLERKVRENSPGPTVVVTHFAPHPGSIAPAYARHPSNPGFVVDLDELMGYGPLWIHGHTHSFFDYSVSGTRVLCNPRGYPNEPTGFVPDLVIEV